MAAQDAKQDKPLTNLLAETEKALANHQIMLRNVKYICVKEGRVPIADFVVAAEHFNYDPDSGHISVDPSLQICGSFWWFSREHINGHEGFVFHKKRVRPGLVVPNFNPRNTRSDSSQYDIENKFER